MWRKWRGSRLLLLILAVVLIVGWGNIYVVKGAWGVASWWFLMAFGAFGLLSAIIAVCALIRTAYIRKRLAPIWSAVLILSLVAAWPLFWLLGLWQIAYPADLSKMSPAVSVRLPLDEHVLVGWGGDTLKSNYPHVVVPSERWAYDLLVQPAGTGSQRLEDYGIYGAEVFAPASGTIVGASDKEEDHRPGTDEHDSMPGNHIYIRLDETGTYLVLAHLMKGSIKVQVGDHVAEGDLLAKVGNSGSSSEPHLHIHHQRQDPSSTSMFLSEGLPLYFRDIEGPSMPKGGMRLEHGKEVPAGDKIYNTLPWSKH
ncbi:M23 family metallopeptidase [Paenibacillus sp. CAA11]|uniref:M23 family metallopeptidase n=1 Tax=Paenibacillus sp. CAA11 TaxID=1532905 RepID=UPI00190211A2|nr:M23 family metallopeptidase [Paenibacillus sp. CAA11]